MVPHVIYGTLMSTRCLRCPLDADYGVRSFGSRLRSDNYLGPGAKCPLGPWKGEIPKLGIPYNFKDKVQGTRSDVQGPRYEVQGTSYHLRLNDVIHKNQVQVNLLHHDT